MKLLVIFFTILALANAGIIGGPFVAGPWGANALVGGSAGILTGHGGLISAAAIAPAGLVTAAAIPPVVIATHGATLITPSASEVAVTPLHPLILSLGHVW